MNSIETNFVVSVSGCVQDHSTLILVDTSSRSEEAYNGVEQYLQTCNDSIVVNGEVVLIWGKFNITLQVGGI